MGAPTGDPASVPPLQSDEKARKRSLRAELLTARRSRSARDETSSGLLSVPEITTAVTVAGYIPLRGEPDVAPALLALRQRGVRVLLPVVLADRDLEFQDASGAVVPLSEVDVVIVPAVAADGVGHRLGRGGGSYDRALPRARPDALILAVVHPEELLPYIPTEPHDASVTAVLAGAGLIRCTA
jgi:5-formyltetrahydrofolate cyclo-ligase